MLELLKIENFQSHKKTELKLCPGVNVIVGQSDSGKTAIFRALKWLVTNRPSGDAFVSWFTQDKMGAEVLLQTDKNTIFHKKGYYSLDTTDFSAIGTGIPEQIQQALKMSDLNWQSQMDAPFLLSESPGEVSRQLNEVADLSAIDVALSQINRVSRKVTSEIEILESQKEQGLAELDKYKSLDILEANLVVLKNKQKELKEIEKFIEQGKRLLEAFQKAKEELNAIPDTKHSEKLLAEIEKTYPKQAELEKTVRQMQRLFSELREAREDLEGIRISLEIKEERFKKEFPKVCPLCGKEK
jgi:DNA repair exonuclease SbcCD ATPase subunit